MILKYVLTYWKSYYTVPLNVVSFAAHVAPPVVVAEPENDVTISAAEFAAVFLAVEQNDQIEYKSNDQL